MILQVKLSGKILKSVAFMSILLTGACFPLDGLLGYKCRTDELADECHVRGNLRNSPRVVTAVSP